MSDETSRPRDTPAVHEPELELAAYRREVCDIYRELRLTANADANAAAAPAPPAAHARWRERRDRLFREQPQSPLAADDPLRQSGLPYWPYDPRLRFNVALSEPTGALHYEIATGQTEVTRIRQVGSVELLEPVGGRLAVWWLEQYGGGLFVPFRDATAASETYGAGRYLLDTAKGADLGLQDGRLILDFNFAYHPSCRYDAAWQCPLAPPENVLSTPVRAGERL
jgi:uncharacterized protein (DUF1684 family)